MKQLKTAFHSAEWVSHVSRRVALVRSALRRAERLTREPSRCQPLQTGTATPLFPERWHIPLSRPASPERPSATGGRQLPTGGPAFSTAASSSAAAAAALPASPWPGGLAPFLPPAGFGTPSVLPDTHGGGDGGRASQDWLAGFGDLLGASPLGGGGTSTAVGGGGGGDGASGGGGDGGSSGLGELAFLDMELGSSWWTNVVSPPLASSSARSRAAVGGWTADVAPARRLFLSASSRRKPTSSAGSAQRERRSWPVVINCIHSLSTLARGASRASGSRLGKARARAHSVHPTREAQAGRPESER